MVHYSSSLFIWRYDENRRATLCTALPNLERAIFCTWHYQIKTQHSVWHSQSYWDTTNHSWHSRITRDRELVSCFVRGLYFESVESIMNQDINFEQGNTLILITRGITIVSICLRFTVALVIINVENNYVSRIVRRYVVAIFLFEYRHTNDE